MLKFGLLLSTIMVVAKLAVHFWHGRGAYAVAALSGLADVDAISLSLLRLDQRDIGRDTVTIAILIATVANTFSKVVMSWLVGNFQISWRLALPSVVAFAAGWFALTKLHFV